jgi:DNA repair protein RecO (recombination protein O)
LEVLRYFYCMLVTTKGIVLKSIKYGETSLIVDIYTEQLGLRKYIVSGVRKKNARIGAALLQVMSQVEIIAYEREGKDLNRLKEIRSDYVYQSIPLNIHKGAVGLFMAEIAQKTLREAESNPALYDFLCNSFIHLDTHTGQIGNLPLSFLVELSGFLGFLPESDNESKETYFDLENGVFSKTEPLSPNKLDLIHSRLLAELLHARFASCHGIKIPVAQRRLLLEKLLDYYRLHIESFPVINSHLILQEILG